MWPYGHNAARNGSAPWNRFGETRVHGRGRTPRRQPAASSGKGQKLVRCRSWSRDLARAPRTGALIRALATLVMICPAMARSEAEMSSTFEQRWDALTSGLAPPSQPWTLPNYPLPAPDSPAVTWPQTRPEWAERRSQPLHKRESKPRRSIAAPRPAVPPSVEPLEAYAEKRRHRPSVRRSDPLPASLEPTLPPNGSPL